MVKPPWVCTDSAHTLLTKSCVCDVYSKSNDLFSIISPFARLTCNDLNCSGAQKKEPFCPQEPIVQPVRHKARWAFDLCSIWKVLWLPQSPWVAGLLIFSSLCVHMCVCAWGRWGSTRKHVKNFRQDPEARFVCKRQIVSQEYTQIASKATNTEISLPNIPLIALSLSHTVFVWTQAAPFTSGEKKADFNISLPVVGDSGPISTSSGRCV